MAGYVAFEYDGGEPDDLLTQALERLVELLPGWTPRETHLEYAILAETTRLNHETRELVADVAAAIFRTFGEKLLGVPPRPGTPATGEAVFTLSEAGRTVPAGTSLIWPSAAGEALVFTTAVDVTAPVGAFVTPAVQIVAEEVGELANGLSLGPLDLIDSLTFVSQVDATTGSAGGTEPESDADYLDRLAESLRLLRRVPVLARDFAILARDVPGVYRALAIDGLDPDTNTTGVERTVAVAAVDEAGEPVSPAVLAALDARLQSEREVNFDVRTMEPTYTAVTVDFAGEAEEGADADAVELEAIDRVTEYLSPAVWGGGDERPPVWRAEPVVRYLDVVGVIAGTPGLRTVTAVTLNGGAANVALAGHAPLPAAAPVVTGNVTPP